MGVLGEFHALKAPKCEFACLEVSLCLVNPGSGCCHWLPQLGVSGVVEMQLGQTELSPAPLARHSSCSIGIWLTRKKIGLVMGGDMRWDLQIA